MSTADQAHPEAVAADVDGPVSQTKDKMMRTHMGSPSPLENMDVPLQAKLAAAWTSFMFLYVYVDILGLYMPGVIDDILAGVVWELDIDQTWATAALTLMAIPILMVVLSMTLPARANKATNLVVASTYVLISVANVLGEVWTYYFSLAVGLEVIVLAIILRSAWNWPCASSQATPDHEATSPQQA